jgi:hypothetical protein
MCSAQVAPETRPWPDQQQVFVRLKPGRMSEAELHMATLP